MPPASPLLPPLHLNQPLASLCALPKTCGGHPSTFWLYPKPDTTAHAQERVRFSPPYSHPLPPPYDINDRSPSLPRAHKRAAGLYPRFKPAPYQPRHSLRSNVVHVPAPPASPLLPLASARLMYATKCCPVRKKLIRLGTFHPFVLRGIVLIAFTYSVADWRSRPSCAPPSISRNPLARVCQSKEARRLTVSPLRAQC